MRAPGWSQTHPHPSKRQLEPTTATVACHEEPRREGPLPARLCTRGGIRDLIHAYEIGHVLILVRRNVS